MLPSYHERPDCGGRYFRCEPYAATISVSQCSANWNTARTSGGERNLSCRGCPLGPVHAGKVDEPVSSLYQAKVCPRCRAEGRRIVKAGGIKRIRSASRPGHRGGWDRTSVVTPQTVEVCVSCANRQYEFLKGRNAKGAKPVKITELPPRSIAYHDGQAVRVHRRSLALDTIEVVVDVLRSCQRTVAFGFRSAPMIGAA